MMDQTPHEVLTQQQDGYPQSFDWSRRRFRCAGDMPNSIFHSESTGARAGPNSSDFCKTIWRVRMLLRLPAISYQAAHEEDEDLLWRDTRNLRRRHLVDFRKSNARGGWLNVVKLLPSTSPDIMSRYLWKSSRMSFFLSNHNIFNSEEENSMRADWTICKR
jgi:hypothetical protein